MWGLLWVLQHKFRVLCVSTIATRLQAIAIRLEPSLWGWRPSLLGWILKEDVLRFQLTTGIGLILDTAHGHLCGEASIEPKSYLLACVRSLEVSLIQCVKTPLNLHRCTARYSMWFLKSVPNLVCFWFCNRILGQPSVFKKACLEIHGDKLTMKSRKCAGKRCWRHCNSAILGLGGLVCMDIVS